LIKPEDFYETKPKVYGIDITVKPDYKTLISKDLIGFGKDKFDEKQALMNPFKPQTLRLLKDYIN
jgi:hypothetical protein